MEVVKLFSKGVCYLAGSYLPPLSASPLSVVVGTQPFSLRAAKISFPFEFLEKRSSSSSLLY